MNRYTRRMKEQEETIQDWWHHWFCHVFASLIPFKRWCTAKRNVKEGDVAMLIFKHKFSAADYQLE